MAVLITNKQKAQKSAYKNEKLSFKTNKNFPVANQIENEINYLKNNIDVDSVKEHHKDFNNPVN